MDISIFEANAFDALMNQGEFEKAFSIAKARKVDITTTFFRFASREKNLCSVILKIIPYLSEYQLETVIQSVAPILEMTTPREAIERFKKQLLAEIVDPERVFHILIWFDRQEDALAYGAYHGLRDSMHEFYITSKLVNHPDAQKRARRFLWQFDGRSPDD
jgi:hypothetical protein